MHDVTIIGAGPAGMSAGIYAAAQKLKTLVIAKELPQREAGSFDIFDFGFILQKFKANLGVNKKYLEFKDHTEVVNLEKNVVSFSIETKKGEILYSRSVIIAVGQSELLFDLLTYKEGTEKIKVNATMATNIPGIFAIGEANDAGKKNLMVLAGEGAKAALSVSEYLSKAK